MEDILPELLEKVRSDFEKNLKKSRGAAEFVKKLQEKNATYADAGDYAEEVGKALAESFRKNLTAETLPDGKMYFNIADRLLSDMLGADYRLVSESSVNVQQILNDAAGIRIKPQKAPLNKSRVEGLVNRVSEAEKYEEASWLLDEPVKTFSRSVVDDTLKANVEFQGKAGLSPKIIRRTSGKCCKWCEKLAGTYEYPDVPKKVYQRHERCRCIVEYDPGSGKKRQNIRSKEWHTPEEDDKIKARKTIGIENLSYEDKSALNQYKSFESYLLNEALREGYPLTEAQAEMMHRLDRALEKLPAFEGVTYRSLDPDRIADIDAFWKRYEVDSVVVENAYTSTSTSIYDESFGIQMIIKGKSGRDLRAYTDFENEILFERNTKFTVTKREGNTIWLEES